MHKNLKTDLTNSAISTVFVWLYYHGMMILLQHIGFEFIQAFVVTAMTIIVVMPIILVLGWEEIYSNYLTRVFLVQKDIEVKRNEF